VQQRFELGVLVGRRELREQMPKAEGGAITYPGYETFQDRHPGE
jgi:hypothetical protein